MKLYVFILFLMPDCGFSINLCFAFWFFKGPKKFYFIMMNGMFAVVIPSA